MLRRLTRALIDHEPAREPAGPDVASGRTGGPTMMCLGSDIGKRWHEAALLDADGTVVWQQRFAPTRAGLADLAAPRRRGAGRGAGRYGSDRRLLAHAARAAAPAGRGRAPRAQRA